MLAALGVGTDSKEEQSSCYLCILFRRESHAIPLRRCDGVDDGQTMAVLLGVDTLCSWSLYVIAGRCPGLRGRAA